MEKINMDEACEILGCSKPTLSRKMKKDLPYYKQNGWFVYFDKKELLKYKKNQIKKYN